MSNVAKALGKDFWWHKLRLGHFEMKRGHWRTEEGKTFKIYEMDTDHIVKALCLIRKTGYTKIRCVTLGRDDIVGIINDMENELKTRKFDDWSLLDQPINSKGKDENN